MPPGLSDSEIEKLTQPFSLILPRSVQEIYRCCNGKLELAPDLFLKPLELAIENTRYADWMRGDKIPSSTKILPLFQGFYKDFYYVICGDLENESPVWCVFVGEGPLEYAASLTSLILTSWECYETGAYYMTVDEDGYSYLEQDLRIGNENSTFEIASLSLAMTEIRFFA